MSTADLAGVARRVRGARRRLGLAWLQLAHGLPAVRLTSRAIRIPEDALDAWIADHVTAGVEERSVSPVRPEPRPPSADPSRTPQVATLRTVTSPVGRADDNRKERS